MTAPPPRLTAAIDAAWDRISKAVATGLDPKESPDSTISTLAKVLVADSSALPPGSDLLPVFEYKYEISRPVLAALAAQAVPATQEVTEWARESRSEDLLAVLEKLVDGAADQKLKYTEEAVNRAEVYGQGGLRLIHLRGDHALADRLKENGVLSQVVDVAAAVNQATEFPDRFGALLMREFGGPYLHRPQDLTLGWEPVDESNARLVLESVWRLERTPTTDKPRVVALA